VESIYDDFLDLYVKYTKLTEAPLSLQEVLSLPLSAYQKLVQKYKELRDQELEELEKKKMTREQPFIPERKTFI